MSTSRFVPSSLVLLSFFVVVVVLAIIQLVQSSRVISSQGRHTTTRRSEHEHENNLQLQQQQLVTSKLLLLTDGQLIKLFPLTQQPSGAGGYYVIKSREFGDNNDDDKLALIKEKAPRYFKWLEQRRKRQSIKNNNNAVQSTPSILPTRRRAKSSLSLLGANDQQLREGDNINDYYSETWKKPFITQVGYFFDQQYCQDQTKQCLVIYWLDASNSIIHFGLLKLNDTKQLHLLETKFDPNGTTNPKNDDFDRPTIWLQQLMPYEINNNNNGDDNCKSSTISKINVDSLRRINYVELCCCDSNNTRLLSVANLGPNNWGPITTTSSEIYNTQRRQDESMSLRSNLKISNLKNVISSSSSSGNLIHLDNNAKINVLDLMDNSQYSLLDVQWETTKSKVRRLHSHKLDQSFSVVDMTLDKSTCGLYWLTSDHEIYSSHLTANARDLETKFFGKLEPRRPLIREPITSMQILHDTLFFMDATRRSLMAYKLPNQRHQSIILPTTADELDDVILSSGGGGAGGDVIKDKRIPKLHSTHQVLLIEMLPIQDFALINLNERLPISQCQVLSEIARRKHDNNSNSNTNNGQQQQQRKSYNNKIFDYEQEESKRNFERLIKQQNNDNNAPLYEPIKTMPIVVVDEDMPQKTKLYLHPVAYVHLIFAFLIFALAVLIICVGLYMELRKRKLQASTWEQRASGNGDGQHGDQQVVNTSTFKKTAAIKVEDKSKHLDTIRLA